MARTFDRNAAARYTVGSASGLTEPFTVCGIYRRSSAQATSAFQIIWAYEETSGILHELRPNNAQRLLAVSTQTLNETATSPANETYDVYNYGAGVWASSTSRTAWLNNGSGTDTGGATVVGDTMYIGNGRGGVNWGLSGDLAELAVWNTNLNSDEINALSKGFKPFRIRPQSLWLYVPMIRNVQDLRSARTLTANGSPTVSTHARVY
jgi:hypothetical protein